MSPATIQTPPPRCRDVKRQAVTFEREFLSCPVTALTFFHDPVSSSTPSEPGPYLLAGEDTQLKVLDVRTGFLYGELRVFEASVVHGISVAAGAEFVLLWGGASVVVVPGRVIRALIEGRSDIEGLWCPKEATAPDWMYDGILRSCGGGSPARGVLVTAHNEIVSFRIVDGCSPPFVSFGAVISPSRPILYSANVCWLGTTSTGDDKDEEVLVAGGTVFGEIIVWKCRPWGDESGGATEVLCVLSGHEGSVFGVTISEELTLPGKGDTRGEKIRLLASCSDDRTVRIWDITERAGAGVAPAGKLLAESRETGFGGQAADIYDEPQTGSTKADAADPKELSTKALAVAMGHQSRIWHVRFCTRGLLSPPALQEKPSGGQEQSASRLTVYSFGEDATAQEWLFTLDHAPGIPQMSGVLSHVNTVPCHGGKHIWSTAMLGRADGGEPLIATGGADGKIALLGATAALAYPVVSSIEATSTSPDVIDVSFAFSDVSPLTEGTSATGHKAKGETFKAFAFVSGNEILVTSTFGNVFLGCVRDDDGSQVSWTGLELPDEIRSDLRGYNIVRGPARTQSGFCFLGSASGAVYMFSSGTQPRLEKITGLGRKVSDIFVLPAVPEPADESSAHTSDDYIRLVVTLLGHDEAFFVTIAHPSSSTAVTTSTQSIPVPKGCVITAVDFSGGLLSLGSRDGRLLFFRNCLQGQNGDNTGPAWLRVQSSPETTRSKDAITSIVRLPGLPSGDASPYILATCRDGKYLIYEIQTRADGNGSETISLDLVHDSSPPFGPVITEAWFEEGEEEGGRPELMLCGFRSRYFVVWNETRQHEVATVDCGGVHRTYAYITQRRGAVKNGADGTLRQEWVRFAYSKAQRTHMYTQQGAGHTALKTGTHGREVRAASCGGGGGGGGGGFVVSLVLSNSEVKTYRYSRELGFVLLARGMYTGACLTQVRHLLVRQEGDDLALRVLTASTDGSVVVWEAGSNGGSVLTEYAIRSVHSLHQSSIKGLDVWTSPTAGSGWVVLTAGDDNALGILQLHEGVGIDATDSKLQSRRAVVRSAHAAGITGIRVIKSAPPDEVLAATISNDQRVKLWRVRGLGAGKEKGLRVELVQNKYSAVADAGDLALSPDGKLVVAGVGVEVWEMHVGGDDGRGNE
ncbi:WD repeat-containing protein [Magnaporthiopsis poae ATCC 64411]|uniref:WD repeat-containing protein n=1 Tax=Magnaporthiopsis poae (strain ATCC 64411 / 73-15) TaxID=644358 RepID=A0A0C4DKW9_MAGP6|nr:WD repeat-containing protein [Magnaporthiopsis poae ATCC 64411]